MALCILRYFHRQQLGQRPLGTDVLGLGQIQILLRFQREGYGQETIEAAGVVGSVFVLGAAIHIPSRLADR